MSARKGAGPLATGTGPHESRTAAKPPNLTPDSTGTGDIPALFDAVVESHAYGRTTTIVPSPYVTGPGPRPATAGLQDAHAPHWWWADAERVVMALVDTGHHVSSDDLHERFPDEPSASGAAFGALFARLAREGKLREVGMVRSRRPEARRRRIIAWGTPS